MEEMNSQRTLPGWPDFREKTRCASRGLLARQEATQDMTHIARISPVAWQHMNFYGRYDFTTASEPINMEEIVEALVHHPILSIADEEDT